MRRVFVYLLAAAALQAQIGIITRFPPQLKQYLELTDAQVNRIGELNSAFTQFASEKWRRTAQVQFEIAQETAKPELDAMALGLRHLELEGIRRQIAAEQRKTVEEVQKLLTAPQRAKLSTLQQAMLVYSTACDAIANNLMTSPAAAPTPNPFFGNVGVDGGGIATFLLGGALTRTPGCVGVGSAIRVGDFLPGPVTLP
jgi:hypothetical protein